MSKATTGGEHKGKRQFRLERRWVAILALFILSLGFTSAYGIAKLRGGGRTKVESRTTGIRGLSSQGNIVSGMSATHEVSVNLSGLYEKLNCECGNCDSTLAKCECKTAKLMKDRIASLKQEQKTEKEILDWMVDRYGLKVLASKSELIKRQPPPGMARPSIHVEPDSYDFGTIPQRVVSHSFIVRNDGDDDLVVSKITTSCGCTKAQIDQNTIPPGKRANLTVTFDPKLHNTRGKVTRTVFLQTNDPLNSVKKIKLRAFVRKEKKAAGELPSFAHNSARSLEAYRIATQIPEVLEAIPCYCGCGIQSKHRHLKDCFLRDDASFEEHASECNVCESEAIDVKKLVDSGVPIKEIRARIDEKYGGLGTATGELTTQKGFSPANEKSPPKIKVIPEAYNFGKIPPEKVSHTFLVKNAGGSNLEIYHLSTSCKCTTASIDRRIIEPGETAKIVVNFDPTLHRSFKKGEVVPMRRTIYVRSNDPKTPEKTVSIIATVIGGG